jgi:gamma-glutamyltranspeptidase/glutathione hydrolase
MDVAAAVDAPRFLFGRTWGAESTALKLENRFDAGLVARLREVGHDVDLSADAYSEAFGHAGALVRRSDGAISAAHDPRSDGGANGI